MGRRDGGSLALPDLDVWKIIVRFTLPYILNGLLVKCELEVGLNRGRKLEQRDQDSYSATVGYSRLEL